MFNQGIRLDIISLFFFGEPKYPLPEEELE